MSMPSLIDKYAERPDLTPAGFNEIHLGMKLYPWQCRTLNHFIVPNQVSLLTPNGAGKTANVCCPLVLWALSFLPECKVVTTAGVYRQVRNLWQDLAKYGSKIKGAKINESDARWPNGNTAIGFSADNAEAAEGHHAKNLVFIIDEAKSVKEGIFEAMMRCRQGSENFYLLQCSTAGVKTGSFYRSRTSASYLQESISVKECPHITQEQIDSAIQDYGSEHALIRSMIYCEFFDESSEDVIFTYKMVDDAMNNPPHKQNGWKIMFCDVAAGGDENVIAICDGNKVTVARHWRDENTMATCGTIVSMIREHNVNPANVYVDEGGLGIPMVQRINEMLHDTPVNGVNFGAKANNPVRFKNLGTEIWFTAREKLDRFIIPKSDKLKTQLCDRYLKRESSGVVQLESKKDMKKRYVTSPDWADAVCGAIYYSQFAPAQSMNIFFQKNEDGQSHEQIDTESMRGFYAGKY